MILPIWRKSLGNLTLPDAMLTVVDQGRPYIWKIFRVVPNYDDDLGSNWKNYLKPCISITPARMLQHGKPEGTMIPVFSVRSRQGVGAEDLSADDWYICHTRYLNAFIHLLRGDQTGTRWYKDWSKVGGIDLGNLNYRFSHEGEYS